MNYDPNFTLFPNTARQEIVLSLAMWEYQGEISVVTENNLSGWEAINFAIEKAYDELPEDRRGIKKITLRKGDAILLCDTDEPDCDTWEWLAKMVVGTRITSITPSGTMFP